MAEEISKPSIIKYSNKINVLSSFYDIYCDFKLNTNYEDDEFIRVHMSPESAKRFSALLSNAITTYEEKFGEIKTHSSNKQKALKKVEKTEE